MKVPVHRGLTSKSTPTRFPSHHHHRRSHRPIHCPPRVHFSSVPRYILSSSTVSGRDPRTPISPQSPRSEVFLPSSTSLPFEDSSSLMAHPAKPVILVPSGFIVRAQTGFPLPPPEPGPRQEIGPQPGRKVGRTSSVCQCRCCPSGPIIEAFAQDLQPARQSSTLVKMMKGLFKNSHSSQVDTPGGATTGVLPNDVDM